MTCHVNHISCLHYSPVFGIGDGAMVLGPPKSCSCASPLTPVWPSPTLTPGSVMFDKLSCMAAISLPTTFLPSGVCTGDGPAEDTPDTRAGLRGGRLLVRPEESLVLLLLVPMISAYITLRRYPLPGGNSIPFNSDTAAAAATGVE